MKKVSTQANTLIFSLILIFAFSFQSKAQSCSNNISFVSTSIININTVNKAIVLEWITSQEVNNSHFEIERSFTGINFSLVGLALDGFEKGTKKEYAFKDYSPLIKGQQVVYYRLKQYDNDGKFSYSSIHVVHQQSNSISDIEVSTNSLIVKK